MNWELSTQVQLACDRIPQADGDRQQRTAAEILRRLNNQPGVVLADEVGMGKTFVALAVAVSVVEATRRQRPVLVLVPPSVQHKWPKEWHVFAETCLTHKGPPIRATSTTVTQGSALLRLLDDPPERRNHIIFATHGAFDRTLTDPWIQLVLVRRAFLRRPALAAQRKSFIRWAGSIIPNYTPFRDPALVEAILDSHPRHWRSVVDRLRPGLIDDDPVPAVVLEPVTNIDPTELVEALSQLPYRDSKHRAVYLSNVRSAIREVRDDLWRETLAGLNLRLPLLILDEAHHARNPHTRLASLLGAGESESERGALAGTFDRMLFLTATPFQLGHKELIRVLDRFDGVRWQSQTARSDYQRQRAELGEALDRSQASALRFQTGWGRLSLDEVLSVPAEWWSAPDRTQLPDTMQRSLENLDDAQAKLLSVEAQLQPWVIRHSKGLRDQRRAYHPGQQILGLDRPPKGIDVEGEAVLPFLLAARAQGLVSTRRDFDSSSTRAFFAEGLASSFEAYRQTRQRDGEMLDEDATGSSVPAQLTVPPEVTWYLDRIDDALPARRAIGWGGHPKLSATVQLAVDLWERREKLLVFCFYVATGRALRTHISRAVHRRTIELAASSLGVDPADTAAVEQRLESLSLRFFAADTALSRETRTALTNLVSESRLDPATSDRVIDVAARFLRTPSFLARYVPLGEERFVDGVLEALQPSDDESSLARRIQRFASYVESRVEAEREGVLTALEELVTGIRSAGDTSDSGSAGADDVWVPDVRLANGRTKQDARERLMLAFNSPFFPDVLVASAVMGEGVDLHVNCRHVVHHDGDWNPSVLEQRTGRVDRLAGLAERVHLPVVVFEPYLAGAQDEKQFLVVKDRDRWFNVVMGAPMEFDEASTDRALAQVPFPQALASQLTLSLSV